MANAENQGNDQEDSDSLPIRNEKRKATWIIERSKIDQQLLE
jgi:hypothetical protein